jgi:hypothetical protein
MFIYQIVIIPAKWEVKIVRWKLGSLFEARLGRKFLRLHLNQLNSWAWWPVPVILARQEA